MGASHAFFSLREKYPSEAMGDEGLIDGWETTATPSVAGLLVPWKGDNAVAATPSVAGLLVPLEAGQCVAAVTMRSEGGEPHILLPLGEVPERSDGG